MTIDVRPADVSEMEAYRRVATTSLMVSPELWPPEAVHAVRPDMTLCAFDEGELATAYAWWPLKLYLNGGLVPVAGITFVGTLPVYRRRGHLRRVVQKHFETLHETGGHCLTVLIASQAAIYQRYGYGVVSSRVAYQIAPHYLRFAQNEHDGADAGRLRELGDDANDLLYVLYDRFCAHRNGYLKRGPAMWAGGVLRAAPPNGVLCKVLYEDGGQPQGYVVYTLEARNVPYGQPWQRVQIRDMAWLTPTAYRALWQHFESMQLADAITCQLAPADDPLPHLLLEPRQLNATVADGLLARLVDVDRALAARPYPIDGELYFELTDTVCPWNEGRWRLTVSEGRAVCERSGLSPEVAMPVDTLAMLLFGQITPTQAARMGRLTAVDQDAQVRWDHMMQTGYRPFCPDFF